ncbi:MAG: 50S ribosomal protein L11 methyltransferase [Deltaproteobacteria bacterium]|nr:50S ribosomal protein L11 methyltransferase [Deltaproteobacteria bacterium]
MTEMQEKWVEITLTTSAAFSDALANFLEELGAAGVYEEEKEQDPFTGKTAAKEKSEIKAYLPWDRGVKQKIEELETYLAGLKELFPKIDKPVFATANIVDPDWGEQWKKFFKPIKIGNYIVIKPTWERFSSTGRDVIVEIDPGMAFGTGQHPSTQMCIIALEDIIFRNRSVTNWNVLDIGTGTGILAICAVKLGAASAHAIDIDPKAVEIAGRNAEINGVAGKMEIENRDATLLKGSYNLITANLTAATLIKIHSHLLDLLAPGGYLIASGIMEQDMDSIEKVFQADGLFLREKKNEREWLCYVFGKEAGQKQ